MKISILIGFCYDNIEKNKLPGIVIDLYLAYKMSLQMKSDQIIIITDLNKDQNTIILLNAITEGIVDAGILNFIENIKKKNIYHKFTDKIFLVELLETLVKCMDQIFIYYTGHLFKDNIILPNNNNIISKSSAQLPDDQETISVNNFRDIILINSNKKSEIFIVMDCCNGSGLWLPYKLENNHYYLNSNYLENFPSQKLVCFSSTMKNEDSIASRDGSIFSVLFFKQIKNRIQSIPKILKILEPECCKFQQTPNVFSSRPNLKILWNWLFNDLNFNVKIDYYTNTICIKNKKDNLNNKNSCCNETICMNGS